MNKPVSSMTTKELLAEYNAGTGKNATKFSSREAGVQQVEKLRRVALFEEAGKIKREARTAPVVEGAPRQAETPKGKGKPQPKPDDAPAPISAGEKAALVKAEAHRRVRPPATETQKRSMAEGTKASWADPDVAAARSTRHKVEVRGVVYKSLAVAFAELGMAPKGRGRLRLVLKRKGTITVGGLAINLVIEEE